MRNQGQEPPNGAASEGKENEKKGEEEGRKRERVHRCFFPPFSLSHSLTQLEKELDESGKKIKKCKLLVVAEVGVKKRASTKFEVNNFLLFHG